MSKTLLYNIEAEQIVLGKIITNNDYYSKLDDFLKEEYFYELAHKEIYSYIKRTINRTSIVADSVTLKSFFDSNETLLSIGGSNYIGILLSNSSGIVDVISYAKLIQDLAIRRKLAIVGEEIVNDANNNNETESSQEQIEKAESKLFELSNKIEFNKGFISISDAMAKTINNIALARKRDTHVSGVTSGLKDLNEILGGFQNSDLIILAGRPSMGKTTLAINIAYNAAVSLSKENKSVAIISLEMPSDQISAKLLSIETKISTENFRKGIINENQFQEIIEESNKINKLKIFIDDTPALSISSIKTRIRRLIKQENLAFVVIDYLQLIHGSNESYKNNRVLEISEITQGLKAIAKEFNIPILSLSQLSRTVEHRDDKKPQLSDLRESGSIEQDADVVMFIYREVYYEERNRPKDDEEQKMAAWKDRMDKIRNTADVMIAKHRNGPIGNIKLYFNPEHSFFNDYTSLDDSKPYTVNFDLNNVTNSDFKK